MGKKTEKLRRVVAKLSDRYGAEDQDVLRLGLELKVLESLEVARPERRAYKAQELMFQTPAKQLYFASMSDLTH
ncbi:hypothetical protein [Rhodoferax saidenbachensis]|uniref:Uncharacterized protein n=1 Tax=Rhodoferax saidenbachensis TaxID=1484693 RepID=A0A1P8K914_9BURK|nr:hypothetical protein [Rhodoferax saidenbachensis]APW42475.1 hypothetical protein RS694_07965 [Rhodoferax saidenbachensis]